MRGYYPNGLPTVGWYERWEGIVSGVPPSGCWLCGSDLMFVNNGRNALCPRCDIPSVKERDALVP